MRASLHTIGCRLNQAETAHLADQLQRQGYELVEHGQPTDLFVLNTCSVTENAERECRYEVRRALRHSPNAFVAVAGCYAQTGGRSLSNIPGIDLIVGTQYKASLPDYLPIPELLKKRSSPELLHTRSIEREEFAIDGVGRYASTRANVKIQDGCNVMCSFCIIPFARGHERSRALQDVMREAEALAAHGHRELILTGVNIGRYESHGVRLTQLIRRLEAIAGIERIRISSIEPTTIDDDLLAYMAVSPKLCRYLHIPLQSGDNRILAAMNRRYDTQEYRVLIERIVRGIPDIGLGTDLMVGFPGEGDEEFANTLALATELPFAYFHVFSFSPRPGTAATRLHDRVPSSTIAQRSRLLAARSRAKRLAFYQRGVGQIVTVLFEEQDPSGLWTGWTGNYVRVAVRSDTRLANHTRRVLITGVMDGLAIGQLVS